MTEYRWQQFEQALDRRVGGKKRVTGHRTSAPKQSVKRAPKRIEEAAHEKRAQLALQTWRSLSSRQQNAVVKSLDLDLKSIFSRKSLKRQNAFLAAINLLLALKK